MINQKIPGGLRKYQSDLKFLLKEIMIISKTKKTSITTKQIIFLRSEIINLTKILHNKQPIISFDLKPRKSKIIKKRIIKHAPKLSQAELKHYLKYNEKTGIFTWNYPNLKKNKKAGSKNSKGYLNITIDGFSYQAHRLAWLYVYGYNPENMIDHIDRNKINNAIENLRLSSALCNRRNSKVHKKSKTGITGVKENQKKKNKYSAYICVNYKNFALGNYIDKGGAAMARWTAEKKYNFPDCNSRSSAYLYLKKHNLI